MWSITDELGGQRRGGRKQTMQQAKGEKEKEGKMETERKTDEERGRTCYL